MNVSSAKENILKKIRKALSESTPIPFPQSEGNHSVYQPATQEPEIEFAEQFTKLQGKFIFCIDPRELVAQLITLAGHQGWKNIVLPRREDPVVVEGKRVCRFHRRRAGRMRCGDHQLRSVGRADGQHCDEYGRRQCQRPDGQRLCAGAYLYRLVRTSWCMISGTAWSP